MVYPRVVRDCIQYLRESGMRDRHIHSEVLFSNIIASGLEEDGLFRRSPKFHTVASGSRSIQSRYVIDSSISFHSSWSPLNVY